MNTTIQRTLDHLVPVLDALAVVTQRIAPGQESAPTPCSQYDLTALLEHVVGWLEAFAVGYASSDGEVPAGDADEVWVTPAEAAQRIRRASVRLVDAVRGGAADRPLRIGGEGMPGEIALVMILGEYLAHGWDIAISTGQQWRPDETAVRAAHEVLRQVVTPESRGGDWFGEEVVVADDAPQLDRFLGFTGREPSWRPI
ncbi:MAG: TIGR03086 family metal-binding protein [Arachnia propionica]|uniref:TIGR03086 family metal-binding protein n=1 Tax=Arachnia propionica TaxID=1750 RepID=UPI0026F76CC9|nr:TIGR03086 family metal-binding protein [Arachnia propionica]